MDPLPSTKIKVNVDELEAHRWKNAATILRSVAGGIMATIFWGSDGISLIKYLP